MVQFKIGLSRFINRLSLMSSLKLLVSEAKTSKSSKLIMQLHCKQWSETADSFLFLCQVRNSHMFCCSGKKMLVSFTIISNVAVTTCITIN